MGKKRGLLAELQHQSQVAQRKHQQQASAAYKANLAAAKRAEDAQRQYERAKLQYEKATVAEQKAMEREAKRLHEDAMLADVEQRNAELTSQYEQIDGILKATLDVDDYVDLQLLRKTAEHQPFTRSDLELPTPKRAPVGAPAEPTFVEPEGAPRGIGGMFGAKKKHAEAVAQARAEFDQRHQAWQAEIAQLPARQAAQDEEYQQHEQQRLERLAQARHEYDIECQQRDAETATSNAQLDTLIANLAYDVEEAIQEYVSIVLGNSVYPDCFQVEHDFEFSSALRELTLTVSIPQPEAIPHVKEYKYVRAKDEISATSSTVKEQKDRYSSALCQVALRTLQEVFEADRPGKIRTITLTVGTEAIDKATGRMKQAPLLAVAVDRETFMSFDLSNVLPSATLQHLNALVSKNPFDLVPIDTSKGVRGK